MSELRADHDRWFWYRGGCHLVPAGKAPEEAGVDSRMAVEVDRPPAEDRIERWVAGAWRIDKTATARLERARNQVDAIEAEVWSRVQARIEELAQKAFEERDE